jgi:hypothetical protein
MHIVPLFSGLIYLSGLTSLPKYSAAGAWLFVRCAVWAFMANMQTIGDD